MWRWLWLVLLLLLLGGGGLVWWEVSTSQSAVSQTLLTYCNALEHSNYQQAYEQWATVARQKMSETDFAYSYQRDIKIAGCSVSNISEGNTSASGTITFYYVDGSTTVAIMNLVLENGNWKLLGQSSS